MKKTLLSIFTLAFSTALFAQANCTADYDFGAAPFGVSPDPAIGETFDVGVVGEPYLEVIHIKIPSDASELELEGVMVPPGVAIDSIALESVSFSLSGTPYTLEQMGLEINCNNGGDSPNPCTFMGNSQNCATLSGTPTTPGVFGLSINVVGYITVFGNVTGIPVSFDQYSYEVTGEVNVPEVPVFTLALGQNMPNPATDAVKIPVTLEKAGAVNFTMVNLLGAVVVREQFSGVQGQNTLNFNVANLEAGLYLYSIDVNGKRLTKRMIINR